jgi:DNA-binding transcriptional regulator YiaG
MKCDKCHGDRLATRVLPEYRTDALGLPNVTLLGIAQELYCRDCGERLGVSYPNLEGILAALALARAQNQQKFGGLEVRFMRKALKWTTRELAARLGVREETVSRWEHDREPIGPGSEKLLRLMAVELLAENAPAVELDRRRILLDMQIKPASPGRHVPLRLKSVQFKRNRKRERAYAIALSSMPDNGEDCIRSAQTVSCGEMFGEPRYSSIRI